MASAAVHEDTALATTAPEMGPARDDGWRPLAAGWVVLATDRLRGFPAGARPRERRFLLMHSDYGIVVLELWSPGAAVPGPAPAPDWLEAELRLAGFLRRFDPRLPIRRIHLAVPELPRLLGVLARAFAGTEPLRLPCGSAWMAAVQATLAAPSVAPSATDIGARPGRAYPRPARWPHLAIGGAGLCGLAIAALLIMDGRRGEAPRSARLGEGATGPAPPAAVTRAQPEPWPAVGTLPPMTPALIDAVLRDALAEADAADPAMSAPGLESATLPEPEALHPAAPGMADAAVAEPEPPAAADADANARPAWLPPPVTIRALPSRQADAAGVVPLPKPGLLHLALLVPDGRDALRSVPLPRFDAPRLPPPAPAEAARFAPLPAPGVPHPVPVMQADIAIARIAPLLVPAAPPAAAPMTEVLPVASPPDADEPPPPLPMPHGAEAARAAPLPEPEAARLPPEPDALRAAPPASIGDAGTAPAPEPDAASIAQAAPAAAPAGPASHDTTRAAPAPEAPPAAPPPAAAPSAAVVPPPTSAPVAALDPKVIELLIARGNEMLARGDISAARLLYGRAAAAGSAAALTAMGRSYDPAVLGALGVRGIRPDPEQAALWYRRAAERGAASDGRSER